MMRALRAGLAGMMWMLPVAGQSSGGAPAPGRANSEGNRPAVASPSAARLGPRLDENGWPIAREVRPISDEADEPVPQPRAQPPGAGPGSPDAPRTTAGGQQPALLASGSDAGSPLLPVLGSVGSAQAMRALGGVTVWWRVTIFGAQGEPIGTREIQHLADLAFPERDRLEFADGRVYGRSGAAVFAERQGMPWPTLTESAAQELALFGLHLRLPWAFADAHEFVVVGREAIARGAERFVRIHLQRRPANEPFGPELQPAPADRFELLCEEGSGRPREFVHNLAISGQARRVLLDDWRDVGGLQIPQRRTYVDEAHKQTTELQIQRIETGTAISERQFRLR